jgi:large subunit ribosomal protein L28
MSRTCDICGKHPQYGYKVSNSYNHTRRTWRPNLIKIKTQVGGTTATLNVCARCLRSGFVTKKVNVIPANAGATKTAETK